MESVPAYTHQGSAEVLGVGSRPWVGRYPVGSLLCPRQLVYIKYPPIYWYPPVSSTVVVNYPGSCIEKKYVLSFYSRGLFQFTHLKRVQNPDYPEKKSTIGRFPHSSLILVVSPPILERRQKSQHLHCTTQFSIWYFSARCHLF